MLLIPILVGDQRSLIEISWMLAKSATSATAIAVRRGEEVIPSPEPELILLPGDVVYLIGKRENVLKAIELLESEG